jgi:hypothetical protein
MATPCDNCKEWFEKWKTEHQRAQYYRRMIGRLNDTCREIRKNYFAVMRKLKEAGVDVSRYMGEGTD